MMDVDVAIAARQQQPIAETFVSPLPRLAVIGSTIEFRGMIGEVIEILTPKEWLEEWSRAGMPASWASFYKPQFYCRCRRVGEAQ